MSININQESKIVPSPYSTASGDFFKRLEAVRANHYNKVKPTVSSLKTRFVGTNDVQTGKKITTSAPTLLRSYMKILQNSPPIESSGRYFTKMNIPAVGELLSLERFPKNDDSIITQLESICAFNSFQSFNAVFFSCSNFASGSVWDGLNVTQA